ncbi:hypothetical protein LshimejAT787_0805520 [Lyophyllum shimeji]|uniref:DUF7918 domain-containing protein n=1 Tax=Lyophyllum shimeji TaxID=47721 RepID=A0A9P3PSW7_LYOSH|nr:hypothetical protein LshimejAT787_0805520 [Lyophyllum shimeji]
MQLLGFDAYITVDGAKLPEYEVKLDDGAKTATCWIPSQAGKSFAINWRPLQPRPFDLDGQTCIDGLSIGGKLLRRNLTILRSQDHCITSSTTSRPLSFSSIQLTDDDAYLNSENIENLGDIVLGISRVEITGETQPKNRSGHMDWKVHERSKKAMVHRIKLGEEVQRPDNNRVMSTETICTLATFTFKYRSIDVLRADGIAPLDAAAQSNTGCKRKAGKRGDASSEDENHESDGEDEAELQAQLRLIQAKLAKKRGKSKTKKIKTEPISVARPRLIPGEIIDLT